MNPNTHAELDDEVPATQDMEGLNQSMVSAIEIEGATQQQPWGKLHTKSLRKQSLGTRQSVVVEDIGTGHNITLAGPSFTVGREHNCSFVFRQEMLAIEIFTRVSKVHFELVKDVSNMRHLPARIIDRSSNGTFVNGEIVGKGKSRLIMDKDKISIVYSHLNVFEYFAGDCLQEIPMPQTVRTEYFPESKIGSGAFGTVYKALSIKKIEPVALKIIQNDIRSGFKPNTCDDRGTNELSAINEARILQNIRHPCIVRMINFIPGHIDFKLHSTIVLEYMDGGDLLQRITQSDLRYLSEDESRFIFFQLCHAVGYLHSRGITHRDIKPENVLLKTRSPYSLVKLTDFGLSKIVQQESMLKSQLGTPCYVAPEVLTANPNDPYTEKVDVWSMGVVLFACISGTLPFADDYGTPAAEQIKKGDYQFAGSIWRRINSDIKRLIRDMLVVRPANRIGITGLLRNDWLSLRHKIIGEAKKLMDAESQAIEDDVAQVQHNVSQLSKKIRHM